MWTTNTRRPSLLGSPTPISAIIGCLVLGTSYRRCPRRDITEQYASRRICPGIPLAEEQIFLAVVSMLWAFKIEQVPGMPVDLKGYEGGVSCRSPAPFHVTMTPRHRLVTGLLGLN